VDIVCADSIDARGDLNLNGLANEIADAVMYTNYFLYGPVVFDTDIQRRAAQVAASDVNGDGHTLTVGDLVYLIRIITGDASPVAKLSPFTSQVEVRFDGSEVSTESGTALGALLLTFRVGEDYKVTNLSDLTLQTHLNGDELTVLVYDISQKSIAAGLSAVLQISGASELLTAEVADYNGNQLSAHKSGAQLPQAFSLNQNYPNPFNPETVIEYALPTASEVTITVYNLAGQTVATLVNGFTPAGYHQVRWNGTDQFGHEAASGVYFYKISTPSYSETKKMLLVK